MATIDRVCKRSRRRGTSTVEYLLLVGLIAVGAMLTGRALYRAGDKASAQADCITADGAGCGGGESASGTYALAEATEVGELPSCPTDPPAPPRGFWRRAGDVLYGFFVDGAWGTVTGLWDAGRHPLATVQGLRTFAVAVAQHPGDVWDELEWRMYRAQEENPERFWGSVLFEVATLALPPAKVGEVGKAKWAARTAQVLRRSRLAAEVELSAWGWRRVNSFPHGGTLVNCTRCVVAVDVCLEGAAACALPMRDPLGNATGALGNAVDTVDLPTLASRLGLSPAAWKLVGDEAALAAEALSWGEGGKGVVAVSYTVNGQRYGHVFNVAVRNGQVLFLDGQTNTVYTLTDLAQQFPSPRWEIIRSRDGNPGVIIP